MESAELDILRFFRHYRVGPAEMLFFTPAESKIAAGHFLSAMRSLIAQGLVIKERPEQAYSLTRAGYRASMATPALCDKSPRRPRGRRAVAR